MAPPTDPDLLDEHVIDTPNGEVEIPVDIVEAPVADDLVMTRTGRSGPADLLPVAPTEPDDLERQLAKDEEMERQNRHEHHEAPHFRKESD